MKTSYRILVAPLNWGIGHASRCIPLIQSLLNRGHEVMIASDGDALAFLKTEFPSLDHYETPSYGIRYPHQSIELNIARSMIRIRRAVKEEHQFLHKLHIQLQPDAIISDNRYGMYHRDIPSVIMTHQLNIQHPNLIVRTLTERYIHKYISRFDTCWIPDFQTAPGIAGQMSHPSVHPNRMYLGPLSRLKNVENTQITYDLCCILSGPEPQREKLEKMILRQIRTTNITAIIAGGKPGSDQSSMDDEQVRYEPFLTASELSTAIASSKMVLGRSGYSTIMDLMALGKPAILIPTPGQSEQEYLAETLKDHPSFLFIKQADFKLPSALEKSASLKGSKPDQETDEMEAAISSLERLIGTRVKQV